MPKKAAKGPASSSAVFDVAIIGMGMAGLSAAVFLGRANVSTVVIGDIRKSQLASAADVGNYLGSNHKTGMELLEASVEQVKEYGATCVTAEVVSAQRARDEAGGFVVKTADNRTFRAKCLVIATGIVLKPAGIPGEKQLLGKGVHSCVACLAPESKIITNPSSKYIEEIKPGDKVLGDDGEYHECRKLVSKDYGSILINLKSRFQPEVLRLTPEHLVLAAKRPNITLGSAVQWAKKKHGDDWPQAMRRKGILPQWIPAGELSKGDFLFYPIPKTTEIKNKIEISDYVDCVVENGFAKTRNFSPTAVQVKNQVSVSKSLLRLFGYYLAEGSVSGHNLYFDFGIKEKAFCEDVIRIIGNSFGLKVKLRSIGSVARLICSSTLLAQFFCQLFGNGAHRKHIPGWIMRLPVDFQAELVKGFWYGDGCLKKNALNFVTTSQQLALQLRTILLRLGLVPCIYIVKPGKSHRLAGRIIQSKRAKYELELHGPWLRKASRALKIEIPNMQGEKWEHYNAWFEGGYLVVPITRVGTEPYVGKVYDLNVADSHSYTTLTACVHNCDGWAYKGKKVIVIGSANYAAEEALQLTAYTRDITIISNGKEFEISAELIKELTKAGIRMSKEKIFQFNGKAKLESLVLADKTELKPDGVFLAIGAATALAFSLSLAIGTDKDGFIRIDKDTGRTDIDGVYAAGGCTGGNQQIAKSVGEGCNAAIDLIKKLKGLSYYADQT